MWGDTDVEARFSALGGVFVTPARDIAARLDAMQGLLFDWDGVFNAGSKGEGTSSTFDEADSMGINLLRYAMWRARGTLPAAAVITGEDNPTARRFAAREHFDAVYCGVRNKAVAVDEFCAARGVRCEELICVFDDVNDLGMAAKCGVRVLVRRDSSPLLQDYVAARGLCDYITAGVGGRHALREATELLLGLMGSFGAVVDSRVAFDADYARYFGARQAVETRVETGSRA
jgi:3-deoxy-D-manno-octulosonate 8-phosphate phosphatase (KDO 8-P phosphatase)